MIILVVILPKLGFSVRDLWKRSDIIADAWHGYPLFQDQEGRELTVRRVLVFFEEFPVILEDKDEIVMADISFRRAKSKYMIEQIRVSLTVKSRRLLTVCEPN